VTITLFSLQHFVSWYFSQETGWENTRPTFKISVRVDGFPRKDVIKELVVIVMVTFFAHPDHVIFSSFFITVISFFNCTIPLTA